MKKIFLTLLLVMLSLPAFADSLNFDNAAVIDEQSVSAVNDDTQDFPVDEQFAPIDEPRPGVSRYPMYRRWVCIASDRFGRRYVGRSFAPGGARAMALNSCNRGSYSAWWRRCHIVGCFRR